MDGNGCGFAPYDPRGGIAGVQNHFVWPNVTINIEPGQPNLSIDSWIPDEPDRMVGFTDYSFGPDVPDKLQREIIAFRQQVAAEDNSLVESVQRGLRSGTIAQDRLIPEREAHRPVPAARVRRGHGLSPLGARALPIHDCIELRRQVECVRVRSPGWTCCSVRRT
jgi:hypothetical protein